MMVTDKIWPALDYSRIPYRLYHDAEIYEREQRQIFQGPVWNYLGLEAEIPNPGDFRATWVGETPVVFNRDGAGDGQSLCQPLRPSRRLGAARAFR